MPKVRICPYCFDTLAYDPSIKIWICVNCKEAFLDNQYIVADDMEINENGEKVYIFNAKRKKASKTQLKK